MGISIIMMLAYIITMLKKESWNLWTKAFFSCIKTYCEYFMQKRRFVHPLVMFTPFAKSPWKSRQFISIHSLYPLIILQMILYQFSLKSQLLSPFFFSLSRWFFFFGAGWHIHLQQQQLQTYTHIHWQRRATMSLWIISPSHEDIMFKPLLSSVLLLLLLLLCERFHGPNSYS